VPVVVNPVFLPLTVFCFYSTFLNYFNWSLKSSLLIAMSSEYFEATAMTLMGSSSAVGRLLCAPAALLGQLSAWPRAPAPWPRP
jgi:uncharacterized membrane protein YbaN (DUF454 family)